MPTDIKVGLVPEGRLSSGNYGILQDESGNPLISAMEVLDSKPSVDDPNNFVGRLVFEISSRNIYVWTDTPVDEWVGLQISNVTVAAPIPTPALNPISGELYYATDTEILYLWDGVLWVEIGGRRGASVIWRHYVADGLTDQYSTGATTFPPVEFVNVYIDGVVQEPGANGLRDYYMVGNDVKLNSMPTNGERVVLRTLTHITAVRNSKFYRNDYITDGISNKYDLGTIAARSGQVWVYVDGVHQRSNEGNGPGTYDFIINTKDTSISTLTFAGGVATATTVEPHGFVIGDAITILGADQTPFNNAQIITSVPDSTTFTYSPAVDPGVATATTTDVITYSPIKQNDTLSFVDSSGVPTPIEADHTISVHVAENVTVGEVIGEVNFGENVGTGEAVFKEKTGEILSFKTIRGGDRISISSGPNEITISSQSDSYRGISSFNGVSSQTYTVQSNDYYIAVRNVSGGEVIIDLDTNIPTNASSSGRVLLIKDEARNAGVNNIRIRPNGSSTIEDLAEGEDFVMNTNGQVVELIMDGQDWHVIRS